MHIQIEEEDFPSNLSVKRLEETNIVREDVKVKTSERKREGSPTTLNPPDRGGIPPPISHIPPMPPIDQLVRPKNHPIVVP